MDHLLSPIFMKLKINLLAVGFASKITDMAIDFYASPKGVV